jgi:hypothetical protein
MAAARLAMAVVARIVNFMMVVLLKVDRWLDLGGWGLVAKWSGEKRELQDEYLCRELLMRYVLICEYWSCLHSVTSEYRAALEWAGQTSLTD